MPSVFKVGETVQIVAGSYAGCIGTVQSISPVMLGIQFPDDSTIRRVRCNNVQHNSTDDSGTNDVPSLEDDQSLCNYFQGLQLNASIRQSILWVQRKLNSLKMDGKDAMKQAVEEMILGMPCVTSMVQALSLKARHILEGNAAYTVENMSLLLLQLLDWDEATYSTFPTSAARDYKVHTLRVADGINVRDELVLSLRHILGFYATHLQGYHPTDADACYKSINGVCPPELSTASGCGTSEVPEVATADPSCSASAVPTSLCLTPSSELEASRSSSAPTAISGVPFASAAHRLSQEVVASVVAWHIIRLKDAGAWDPLWKALRHLLDSLGDDEELYIPTGWKGHVVGLCIHRCTDSLLTRIDNRGQGSEMHPSHPWYKPIGSADVARSKGSHGAFVGPLVLREDSATEEGIDDLMQYLKPVLRLPWDGSQKANAPIIYAQFQSDPSQILARLAKQGGSARTHHRRLLHPMPLQTSGNCALATHIQGMHMRLGSLCSVVVDYLKAACLQDIAYLRSLGAQTYHSDDET